MSAAARVLQWPKPKRFWAEEQPDGTWVDNIPDPPITQSAITQSPDAFRLTPPEMLPEKKTRKPRPPRKPPVSLTAEQLLALLAAAKKHRHRDWVLILVTYWHGLRASEAVNLTEADFEGGCVKVQRGKGSDLTRQALQEHENPLLNEKAAVAEWLANRAQFGSKGGAERRAEGGRPGSALLPSDAGCDRGTVAPIVAEKMGQSMEIVPFSPQPAETYHFSPAFEGVLGAKPPGGPQPLTLPPIVASGPLGRGKGHSRLFPIDRKHFWRIVHGYALSVGIPRRKCKTHMLKHTIAKHLIRSGVPINEVQAWLGWKSLETANWYLMADEDELGDRVGKAIRGMGGFRQVQQGSLF